MISSPLLFLTFASASGCSSVDSTEGGTGGVATAGIGGQLVKNGGNAVGGGVNPAGGALNSAGGTSSGGALGNAGGAPSGSGGMNSGGALNGIGGGVGNAGGMDGVGGGDIGSGGGAVTAKWGEVENPSAECTVGALPEFASLTADSKLPDTFLKMDGSRITDKSEWVCRREELHQQLTNFIWGEKPIPTDVSGTVSSSNISVSVTDGGGSTQFSVTVDMNGATAPAPAIIYYDGGLGSPTPIPNGVASIRFMAGEVAGGEGDKSGPFYDVYGAQHPAGYLTAQAWQISRILDVLEQDPSVIDPYRVGLTGCSRNGKGAFVGGALDNRVALTIPVESGLGGTVGLRLVEIVGGAEWPYHGISYVRWMSEVALGPFATGNNAGSDDTDKLPVDMHDMMALIAPRGLYIVDNPGIENLDPAAAWITGNVGKMVFEGLGVGDHMAYEGASGNHCAWRGAYQASLDAMIDKFLLGNDSASTGNVNTDFSGADPAAHVDWDVPALTGDL